MQRHVKPRPAWLEETGAMETAQLCARTAHEDRRTPGGSTGEWITRPWRDKLVLLFEREKDGAYLVGLRASGNAAIAEDAMQDAFVEMCRRTPPEVEYEGLRAYLFTVIRRVARRSVRRAVQGRRVEREQAVSGARSTQSPASAAATAETARAVRRFIEELPPDEREALGLCCELDLTLREASKILGIPRATVGYRLQRALERLRIRLSACGLASATPVAVTGLVRSLGVPPAPASVNALVVQCASRGVRPDVRGSGVRRVPNAARPSRADKGIELGAMGALGALVAVAALTAFAPAGGVTAPRASEGPPAPGAPVAHWKLDETVGATKALDASGNGHEGTIHGGPARVTGKAGGALSLDEVDDRVTAADFDYGSDGTFTVAFWFNVSDLSGTTYQYFFSHGVLGATHSLNIYLCEDSSADGNGLRTAGVLRTRLCDGHADRRGLLDVCGRWDDGEWHHYALAVGASGSTVYIDGIERASSGQGGDTFNPSTGVYLGCREDTALDRYYGGKLDDVRVYRRPLSVPEITDLVNAGGNP
jgi:RNA polymerase sigma factor (sigma-70 family)